MADYTIEQLEQKKVALTAKEQERNQVEAKIQVLSENIKTKFQVATVKDLQALVDSSKLEAISVGEKYTVSCNTFREKWDV